MALDFNRTMVVASFFAAVGSFLIDLGNAMNAVSAYIQALSAPDRGTVTVACLAVIMVAAAGLALIRLMRNGQGN